MEILGRLPASDPSFYLLSTGTAHRWIVLAANAWAIVWLRVRPPALPHLECHLM